MAERSVTLPAHRFPRLGWGSLESQHYPQITLAEQGIRFIAPKEPIPPTLSLSGSPLQHRRSVERDRSIEVER